MIHFLNLGAPVRSIKLGARVGSYVMPVVRSRVRHSSVLGATSYLGNTSKKPSSFLSGKATMSYLASSGGETFKNSQVKGVMSR